MAAALRRMLRSLRRRISRNETMVRWLGLARVTAPAHEPGLILIQIDGLSRHQFERALKARRLPFLRRLIRRRGYRVHTMYSGLPSSTPAVQAELFFGVRCAVPGFSFRDHETGQRVRMFETAPTRKLEERLSQLGAPLLAGGSAYSDIYSGGASAAHFCASTMGFAGVARVANPWVLAGIVFWHGWSVVRTAVLVLVEVVLALFDFVRRQPARMSLRTELKFIPTRVGMCVLLRELITNSAAVDVTRGLPIVHVNYLGYDEQSHHRGPSSAFAHWSLLGIDDAIKRVWQAAKRSQHRKYTLWVYSDHGQQRTTPYVRKFGRTIQQAVADVFGQDVVAEPSSQEDAARGVQYTRAQWLGGKTGRRLTRHHDLDSAATHVTAPAPAAAPLVEVISMGPVGHVYPREPIPQPRASEIAAALVHQAGIPMVLMRDAPGTATAWTRAGRYSLPAQARHVVGDAHPFAEEVGHDLVELCHHPHSGQFIICGWSAEGHSLTFAMENGSHAGPGSEETRAFVLAPADAPIPEKPNGYLRPLDLRIAALRFLGRDGTPIGNDRDRAPPDTQHTAPLASTAELGR